MSIESPFQNAKGDHRPPVALIAGPTASGKSELAVRLAQALVKSGRDAAIVNADSAQVYADLQILSARPSPDEMRGVPHYLYGEWDGANACSAADWAGEARGVIARLHERGSVPILVGGTGLYIRTLLEGIAPVPPIDANTREAVRAMNTTDAFAALQVRDPERAARLAPADRQRILRALEVVMATGKPLSHWQSAKVGGIAGEIDLHPLIVLPDREALYRRCDARLREMAEGGALEEAALLDARNLDPSLPVMKAIGVPQFIAAARGALPVDSAIAEAAQATRNYAKRQYTWFRHQPPTDWPRAQPQNVNLTSVFERLFS